MKRLEQKNDTSLTGSGYIIGSIAALAGQERGIEATKMSFFHERRRTKKSNSDHLKIWHWNFLFSNLFVLSISFLFFCLKYEALTKKKLSLVRHFCEEQRISENKVPSPNQGWEGETETQNLKGRVCSFWTWLVDTSYKLMHPVLIHLSGTERLGEFNLSAPGQVREVMKHYQRYLHVLPLAVSRKDMARNGAVDFDLALCRCSKKDSSYVVDSCWFRFTCLML